MPFMQIKLKRKIQRNVQVNFLVMSKTNKKYGNVYEIKLPNDKYTYVCWIEECSFGIFNYYSEQPTTNIEELLLLGFKIYKESKETAIRKKIWKIVGHIDLEEATIEWPDLAIYGDWNPEMFIEDSKIMRHGKSLVIEQDKYLELVEKGFVYGFFDNYVNFEKWLANQFQNG